MADGTFAFKDEHLHIQASKSRNRLGQIALRICGDKSIGRLLDAQLIGHSMSVESLISAILLRSRGIRCKKWPLLNGAPPLQPRERIMLTNYEQVRISLAHDDLTTAEGLAAKMAREFGDWISVSSSVQLIANSDSLKSARKAFARLSQEAIRLTDRHPEYLIPGCPTDCPEKCANCRSNESGSWVQIDTAVGNPFMGTASPHCGARIQ